MSEQTKTQASGCLKKGNSEELPLTGKGNSLELPIGYSLKS